MVSLPPSRAAAARPAYGSWLIWLRLCCSVVKPAASWLLSVLMRSCTARMTLVVSRDAKISVTVTVLTRARRRVLVLLARRKLRSASLTCGGTVCVAASRCRCRPLMSWLRGRPARSQSRASTRSSVRCNRAEPISLMVCPTRAAQASRSSPTVTTNCGLAACTASPTSALQLAERRNAGESQRRNSMDSSMASCTSVIHGTVTGMSCWSIHTSWRLRSSRPASPRTQAPSERL